MKPVFVAIDLPDLERATRIAKAVLADAGGVKLGLEFFCANGPAGVREIADLGLPVFLDLKLHDIPNTVAKAVAALAPLEPAIVTVHASGGRAMLEAAKAAAPECTKIVAVTVLTSLDDTDLEMTGISGSPTEQVARLAHLSRAAGLDGIVCSGAEVEVAAGEWTEGFFVVPGIRPEGADIGDQKRIVTPRQAIASGASILVIGRPITSAPDPANAIKAITATLSRATQEARI
jgi:orotidine-5'-phosphate decarboxylase